MWIICSSEPYFIILMLKRWGSANLRSVGSLCPLSRLQTVIIHTSSGCVISASRFWIGYAALAYVCYWLIRLPQWGSVHSDANNPEHVVLTANNHAHTLTRGALSCAVIHPLLGQTDGEMMNMLPLICSPSLQPPGNKCAAFFNKGVNDPHEAWIPVGERDREREIKQISL